MNGVLPTGWIHTEIGNIGEVIAGGTPSTTDEYNFGGSIPWITPADLSGYSSKYISKGQKNITNLGLNSSSAKLMPKGTVLFSSRAPIGYVAIASNEVTTNQGFKNIIPNNGIISDFLYYYLKSSKRLAESYASGTTFLEISASKFRVLPIPIAPTNEQHRIVAKIEELFTQLDAGIASLQAAQVRLGQYRKAVLKHAFEGKLTEEWRHAHQHEIEPASVLLERIREERRKDKKYKELPPVDTEGLPEIPEGWVWIFWREIGINQNGRLFPSSEYQESGIKLLRPGNLDKNGNLIWNEKNTRYLPLEWEERFPKYIIRENELVINLTAQSLKDEFLGRICLTGKNEYCLLNQRIARLSPIKINKKFIFWLFKSSLFRNYVNSLNTGSLIQHMFTNQIDEFVLPLPSLREQELIVQEIEFRISLLEKIDLIIEDSVLKDTNIRQSILKKAFEGRLVPQDPNDEPASILLERIRQEKANAEPRRRGKKRNA